MSSIVDIYRLGSTSKNYKNIAQDPILWEKKFYLDFFSRSKGINLNLDYACLYKQKYLMLETIKEKDYRKGVRFIIKHEFLLSIYRTAFFLLLPLKVIGRVLEGVYELLYDYKPLINTSSTSLDIARLDLLEFSKKFKTWRNYEILLIGTLISLLLLLSSMIVNLVLLVVNFILGILKMTNIHQLLILSISMYILRQSLLTVPVLCTLNQKLLERNYNWRFLRFANFTLEILFSIQIYMLFSTLKVFVQLSNGEYLNFT